MRKLKPISIWLFLVLSVAVVSQSCSIKEQEEEFKPLSFEEADGKAEALLSKLTLEEKIKLIGGYSRFFIQALPKHKIPHVFMTDATQGMRLDNRMQDTTIVKRLEKTTAFPAPILLASTWNPSLAQSYAKSIGEECRAAGANILLGPGLNIYRQAQCGRNFEYFGEDPFLTARMIENYVRGVQSTGTAATLKHFVANNTDFYRRRSNSIVDERALHEIYMPGFKAGIDAGAMAVMTAYNKLNGEWCGQSDYVINALLREQLGFKWLVMTDWVSVYDGEKVIKSGQDLEMPLSKATANVRDLLDAGKVTEAQLDRMVKSILRMCIAMGLYDCQQDLSYLERFPAHEKVALETAREGIVLLKNEGGILPVDKAASPRIAVTGKYVNELPHGGGSGYVVGYNNVTLGEALKQEYGASVEVIEPSDAAKLSAADVVLLSIGTGDAEGWDRPFDLPEEELQTIEKVLEANERCVIIVNSGSGINMSPFADKSAAIIYAWYPGQAGNIALAEILSGVVNPSGKLPITIEKRFENSPGFGYLPSYEKLYYGRAEDNFTHQEYDIEYKEGIFTGYRWYEHRAIEPLFAFGHGLSYTTFTYSGLKVSASSFTANDTVEVSFALTNTGNLAGREIAQIYVQDVDSSHPRPFKELKGFAKVALQAGEQKNVAIMLSKSAFSYWNPEMKAWYAEPGEFKILVGSASDKTLLEETVLLQ